MIVILILVFGASNCSTSNKLTKIELKNKTSDISYGVKENDRGFEIEISYKKYQFWPESDALITTCKSQLISTAYDYADEKGSSIKKINEQRIKISMGRNGLTGVMSCNASTKVSWEEEN